MPFGTLLPVDAPPQRPPVNGLLQAVVGLVEHGPADEHWSAGVTFQSPANPTVELYDMCSNDGQSPVSLAVGQTSAIGTGPSFAVFARDQCSSFGWEAQDYTGRARAALAVKEGWGVERQFEQNPLAITGFPYLADVASATTPFGTAGADPVKALFLADTAIANANIGVGMIHALPYMVDLWAAHLLISQRAGQILSPQGNIVVSGNGYTGKGPDGSGALPTDLTAGKVWVYATDLIVLDRDSEIGLMPASLSEAIDWSHNTVRYRGARQYAVRWARLCHAAIPAVVQHSTAP